MLLCEDIKSKTKSHSSEMRKPKKLQMFQYFKVQKWPILLLAELTLETKCSAQHTHTCTQNYPVFLVNEQRNKK